ncbi:uncharacterized protein LOC114241490 [Bombyx mandarina]|uniref:Uncharacterized protein LOC114241490 n=1 Tax=Bombyx mandarina TaxID=7092 RepID=A0A6J2JGG5_BOMMA|nr:uncharacterized protein LOC114241490 [Bombyx mandarina]
MTSVDFVSGWSRIILPIDRSGVGYINLIGQSEDNEIVLIDSFYYKTDLRNEKLDENSDEENYIFEAKDTRKPISIENDSSETTTDIDLIIDDDGSGEPEPEEIGDEEIAATLGPWAIALISFGSVTILAVILVGAYHFGKAAGIAVSAPFFVDLEPSVRIPRVRALRQSPIERIGRTW